MELLRRGAAIDEATSSAYRERIRAAGKNATIPLGTAKVYEQLSGIYLRLGDFPNAYDAAVHARLLEPAKVDNYIVIAQALAEQKQFQEAALVTMEALLASGDKNLMASLSGLYKTGIDSEGCAFQQTPQGPVLNPRCAPVHRDLCRASSEMMKLYRQGGQLEVVDAIRSKAIEQFGCLANEVQ